MMLFAASRCQVGLGHDVPRDVQGVRVRLCSGLLWFTPRLSLGKDTARRITESSRSLNPWLYWLPCEASMRDVRVSWTFVGERRYRIMKIIMSAAKLVSKLTGRGKLTRELPLAPEPTPQAI